MKQLPPALTPDSQPVWASLEAYASPNPELLARLKERRDVGIRKYGIDLHTHDGRDHLRDLEEEILDAIQYAAAIGVREAHDDREYKGKHIGWDTVGDLVGVWNALQKRKLDVTPR